MEVILKPLLYIGYRILDLLYYCLIVQVIMSWLITFGVLNTNNRLVEGIARTLFRITEFFLLPIRRLLPPMSGLDFSPLVLILIIIFLQRIIQELMFKF